VCSVPINELNNHDDKFLEISHLDPTLVYDFPIVLRIQKGLQILTVVALHGFFKQVLASIRLCGITTSRSLMTAVVIVALVHNPKI
jgi:hypothetical protein